MSKLHVGILQYNALIARAAVMATSPLQVKCKKRLEATAGVVTYNEVAATVLGKIGQRIVEVLLILSQSGAAACCF